MKSELLCLATAIFFEARDQPLTGQEMIAEVVMNRVEHDRFPDTVCDVVYQPRQFSFTHDGESDNMSDYTTYHDNRMIPKVLIIAQNYLHDYRLGASSTHYHATFVKPFWGDVFQVDGSFGSHIFYTCDNYC